MLSFIIELIQWVRARDYREKLLCRPYFWGPPDSPEAFARYEALKYACGLSGAAQCSIMEQCSEASPSSRFESEHCAALEGETSPCIKCGQYHHGDCDVFDELAFATNRLLDSMDEYLGLGNINANPAA